MKALFSLSIFTFCVIGVAGQNPSLSTYLPGLTFDPVIPTPQEVLGFQVGEWHVSHDQIIAYATAVSTASDRVQIQEYARSHEARSLVILKITSPENHARLEDIRLAHLADIVDAAPPTDGPAIVYQGFSIHGDEASGGNAALLYLYFLAACQDPDLDRLLQQAVVLLDPCMNPDGFQRFSTWANMHKGLPVSTHPADRQHNQNWPSGRTNHYWFDLNRDWLPAVHPESKGRLNIFHDWKPHLLTDHHEMHSDGTFFFQPGVPSRVHPEIPAANQELSARIGTFHAASLDTSGTLYYSQETFDDFYLGKGSTYPDAMGSIGILFEQASARGNAQDTDHGLLTLPMAIQNHLTTARTSLEAAVALREDLQKYQQTFHRDNHKEATSNPTKGYRVHTGADFGKQMLIRDFLHQHRITYLTSGPHPEFTFVPDDQPAYRLIKSLFTPQKTFQDSLFYDISSWHFPSFFQVDVSNLDQKTWNQFDLRTSYPEIHAPGQSLSDKDLGWLIPMSDFRAGRLLSEMLQAGISVSVATKAINLSSSLIYPAGTVLVLGDQTLSNVGLREKLGALCAEHGISIHGLSSGHVEGGPDLGSPSWKSLRRPEVGLLVGGKTNTYSAGEVWHYLNTVLGMPLTLLDQSHWDADDLEDMNTLIIPHGDVKWSASDVQKLKSWVQRGGTLILLQGAMSWAKGANLIQYTERKQDDETCEWRPYDQRENDQRAGSLRGVSLQVRLDLTHPLTFGYTSDTLAVFRMQGLHIDPLKNNYATPVRCTNDAIISGYLPRRSESLIKGSASVLSWKSGNGQIIGFADQILFRGMTVGTMRLLNNALFFSPILDRESLEPVE